ncbi:hypothetical protein BG004_000654, partial [Podila humilis]
ENQEVTTNNWIESWHKTLKQMYLGGERNVRADTLLHLLVDVVDTDFQMEHIKVKNRMITLPLSMQDRSRKAKADEIPPERALTLVTPMVNEKKIFVRSFSIPNVEYSVRVLPTDGLKMDEPEGLIQSCTCPDNQRRLRPCKHIYLLNRMYEYVRLDRYLQAGEESDRGGDDTQLCSNDYPDWFPSAVVQELYAKHAREREEEKYRQEQRRAEAFADCEKEALILWRRLAVSLGNKKRVCSLEYFNNFIAGLKSVVHDSQGLHRKV